MRWTRPFDYIDGLDFPFPNPCSTPGTAKAWDECRTNLERQRNWHSSMERLLIVNLWRARAEQMKT